MKTDGCPVRTTSENQTVRNIKLIMDGVITAGLIVGFHSQRT